MPNIRCNIRAHTRVYIGCITLIFIPVCSAGNSGLDEVLKHIIVTILTRINKTKHRELFFNYRRGTRHRVAKGLMILFVTSIRGPMPTLTLENFFAYVKKYLRFLLILSTAFCSSNSDWRLRESWIFISISMRLLVMELWRASVFALRSCIFKRLLFLIKILRYLGINSERRWWKKKVDRVLWKFAKCGRW